MANAKLVRSEAKKHFMVANKIYHWGYNDRAKLESHPGLTKDCETCSS